MALSRQVLYIVFLLQLAVPSHADCPYYCTNWCAEGVIVCHRLGCNASDPRDCASRPGSSCAQECSIEETVASVRPDGTEDFPIKLVLLPALAALILMLCCVTCLRYRHFFSAWFGLGKRENLDFYWYSQNLAAYRKKNSEAQPAVAVRTDVQGGDDDKSKKAGESVEGDAVNCEENLADLVGHLADPDHQRPSCQHDQKPTEVQGHSHVKQNDRTHHRKSNRHSREHAAQDADGRAQQHSNSKGAIAAWEYARDDFLDGDHEEGGFVDIDLEASMAPALLHRGPGSVAELFVVPKGRSGNDRCS